jgi:hypothetical protein
MNVAFVSSEFHLSERTACRLLGVERSSDRDEPTPDRNAEPRDVAVLHRTAWLDVNQADLHFAADVGLVIGLEGLHGRLRDECLNASWFRTLNHVRCTLATWREEYNCERPHNSLEYRTPQEFKLALEGGPRLAFLHQPPAQQRLQL